MSITFTFNRFDQHNQDLHQDILLSVCVCDFDFEQVPCHCTVGLGDPDADAMNIAVLPAVTVVELGFVVIDGGTCTVSVADALVIDPATFMNTA